MGAESVGLAETRRTADYQTTVFDCVSKLLERFSGNQSGDVFADDKHGKVRVGLNCLIVSIAVLNNLFTKKSHLN